MTTSNPTQRGNQPDGARAPRDERHPGDDQTSTSRRSGLDPKSRDLDVIPEGEEEITGKDRDEMGEDEDEALERA